MASEQDIQRNIIKYLEGRDYYVVKIITASKRGVPDILACSPEGVFTAIEVKARGKLSQVTQLQEMSLAVIRQRGGVAFVADSVASVIERLTS
jgi:Holliday junction resolvase